ncbi:glycosyltransferase [Brucella sp. TWI559]
MATTNVQSVPFKNEWCTSENFGAGGASRRLVDITREYSDQTVIWQGMVYHNARIIAERTNAQRVVDIGAGAGQKLITFFNDIDIELFQVDWTDNREKQSDVKMPEFVKANFEDVLDLENLCKRFSDNTPTTFILSDVIEHLEDPRMILRVLRSLLKCHPNNRLVLSTPDRDRIDGKLSSSLPDNPTHVRQWTAVELERSLKSGCFVVEDIKYVPENQFDELDRTILVELSCSEKAHRKILEEMSLPAPSDHLVVTTEHSQALYTGGIGTYYKVSEQITGLPRLILFVGGHGLPSDWSQFCAKNRWMHVSLMCGNSTATLHEASHYRHDEILEATLAAIFLYDQIKLIEYQDFSGIGAVIAQAKRARLIPESVCILAYAHGSHLYLDNAAQNINRYRELEIDVRERISMELADVVAFPSKFLRDLYIETGQLDISNHRLQPYPIYISESPIIDTQYSKIDTIVFYGKHTKQKGYFDFCDAVVNLLSDRTKPCTHQIREIVILGSTSPDPRLFDFPEVKISYGVFPHSEVLKILDDLSKRSLVVLPYKGDNHPLSLFEVVSSGSQLLAYRAGGIPEQIPNELHDRTLCNPNSADLAKGIEKAISLSFWDRCCLIRDIKELTSEMYKIHSDNYMSFIDELKNSSVRPYATESGEITVIMPNYNGEKLFLADAFFGLGNSFRRPDHILVIDDCSSEPNYNTLLETIKQADKLSIRVIRNSENLGLAQTRNVGLNDCTTEYVCAHDNDNILLNRFLQLACRVMDLDPTIDAVTCWTRAFHDGDDWQSAQTTTIDYSFRPIGPDIGMGMTNNVFGDAMAVYRTSTLKEFGGWDGTSKAMWEDWQLFLKLAANGKKILVIPKELILYRVRKNSMLRTYPEFDAWMRISKSIPSVPDNNRFGLMRALIQPNWRQLQAENDRLSSEVHRMSLIENSWSWRIVRRFPGVLSKFPRIRATLKYIGRSVAKFIRK